MAVMAVCRVSEWAHIGRGSCVLLKQLLPLSWRTGPSQLSIGRRASGGFPFDIWWLGGFPGWDCLNIEHSGLVPSSAR